MLLADAFPGLLDVCYDMFSAGLFFYALTMKLLELTGLPWWAPLAIAACWKWGKPKPGRLGLRALMLAVVLSAMIYHVMHHPIVGVY